MKTPMTPNKTSKPNSSINKVKKPVRDKEPRKGRWLEDYAEFFTHRLIPVSEAFLERIGEELLRYAKTTNILRIDPFFREKGIASFTSRRWRDKYPVFRVFYEEALLILGERREHGALNFDYNHATMALSQRKYDYVYREAKDEEKALELAHKKELMQLSAQLSGENNNATGGNVKLVPVYMRDFSSLEAIEKNRITNKED
jgi:hypothetical protein